MEIIKHALDLVLHLDDHLDYLCTNYGAWTYVVLFLIIFCETGLVITPFLPGDSLLFAVGAFVARGSLDGIIVFMMLTFAAIAGDVVNYSVGYHGGRRFFKRDARILKLEHLEKTERFYAKYGGKAIVLARFLPIFRTIAPCVAGMSGMNYRRFAVYNCAGGLLWVAGMTGAGCLFGNIKVVKDNFELVIIGIIIVSLIPAAIEVMKARMAKGAVTVAEPGATP
jgi:membrane-associated protein